MNAQIRGCFRKHVRKAKSQREKLKHPKYKGIKKKNKKSQVMITNFHKTKQGMSQLNLHVSNITFFIGQLV